MSWSGPQEVSDVYKLAHMLGSASYAAVCMGGDELAGELAASAAWLTRDLDDTLTRMFVQGNTGLAAPFAGGLTAARETFRDELRLCREPVAPSFIRRLLRPCRRRRRRGRPQLAGGSIRTRLFPR
jgi:hypothetical protein